MYTGFYRVAASSPEVILGDCMKNAEKIIKIANSIGVENKVQLLVFPELCITGYTCADMFLRKELLVQAQKALGKIAENTKELQTIICLGMPVEDESNRLFNCAVYLHKGKVLGIVPKTYIPNYEEFYEKRWFTSADKRLSDEITLNDMECGPITVPFSPNLIIEDAYGANIGTEICEDLWVSSPPSGNLCKAGANIIVNPSASNDVIGKRKYRHDLVAMQSGRCRCGYIYASSGTGESSTDLIFSGHCIITDNGRILNETTSSFHQNKSSDELTLLSEKNLIISEVDLERCMNDRRRYNSDSWVDAPNVIKITTDTTCTPAEQIWPQKVNPYPFIPGNTENRKDRCMEILSLQAKGLVQRLRATGIGKVVLGISGGLDSTLALIVCYEAFTMLNLPYENIYGITMPGFGTTSTTKSIANRLMDEFRITQIEINIEKACRQHMKDIGHPDDIFDVTYENIQARERTQILFDYANMTGGLVIGTGDMSELALGWCTYNGDHMSNYAVNCGVPKTLVKYIVQTYAAEKADTENMRKLLYEIANLPISPELLPPDKDGNIAQKTEENIGKYDLHDFFLYHFLRNGSNAARIQKLAEIAFPNINKNEIEKTLHTFFNRFRTQQFKRSCIPDGPKVGTISLSPRGDLRMPSDMQKLY